MELTLDQALQKGIEAHKAGKVQEADRYYTAILKAQPKHPDANHNMGVLAVGVGKVQEALPFFKTALDANPKIAQFWLSYIDNLIKLDRLDDAKSVFERAKSKGVTSDGFDKIEQRLGSSPPETSSTKEPSKDELKSLFKLYNQSQFQQAFNEAQTLTKRHTKSLTLWNLMGASATQMGQLDKAVNAFQKALSIKPGYADAYNNMGTVLQQQGKLEEAIAAYTKALSIKPNFAETYYNMGITLKDLGKLEGAIAAYTKALSIKPNYAEAYSNMGLALKDLGKPEEAIDAYMKAVSIKPNYAEAYSNMGVALKDQGKLDEAIGAYTKALSIKPDYAEVYNNMGVALKDQGKLNEAIEVFTEALSIKPYYAEACNNMGSVLEVDGKLQEAIKAFKKALVIKPDYAAAWNNLYFQIQAIKFQKQSDQSLSRLYPKNINSTYSQIQLNILDYKLHRGRESEELYLERAIKSLSGADKISIKNPMFKKNTQEKIQTSPNKMVALLHWGRSGTGLMHSLIDGHREVSTLPGIYFSEYFDHSNWVRITSAGWDGMIDHFIATYEVLFDASSSVPIKGKSGQVLHGVGISEGMANVGDQKNEVLRVDKGLFRAELNRLMAFYDELDAFVFFKLVHKAYDRVLNDFNLKSLIFYHIHNPDTYAQLNFLRLNPNASWLFMVREPIQSCESWVRFQFVENDYFGVANTIITMLFEIDNIVYERQRSIGVRLEDLKNEPKKTISALCKWMGIKECESLYEMTAQGKKWWGDPSSPDYDKDGQEPFGKTSIKRKIGSIFSQNDQFILNTIFYPFSVRFGYTEENKEQFQKDLQKIRPMIDEMFDFEKDIAEKMQICFEKLKGSGSYLYLRSGLIERWNTLSKFGTYPNMIMPLKL